METATIIARIEKAEQTIAKKQSTIEKKQRTIAKKTALMERSQDENEAYWLRADISVLEDEIARAEREIDEKKEALNGYRARLAENQSEDERIAGLVDRLQVFLDEIVRIWDAWDIEEREEMIAAYPEACKRYYGNPELQHRGNKEGARLWRIINYDRRSDERIHADNVKAARALVVDLYDRTTAVVGSIVDWDDLHVTRGNDNMAVINGYVIGDKGRAEVRSIYAGGWNIQRLHIRALVLPA